MRRGPPLCPVRFAVRQPALPLYVARSAARGRARRPVRTNKKPLPGQSAKFMVFRLFKKTEKTTLHFAGMTQISW